MAFKFFCTTVGKCCKFPLGGIQRFIVNNELSKERHATCKGRKSVMLYGYMHTYTVVWKKITIGYFHMQFVCGKIFWSLGVSNE